MWLSWRSVAIRLFLQCFHLVLPGEIHKEGAVSKRLITSREGQPLIFFVGQPQNNRIAHKQAKHNQAAHEQPARSDIQMVEMLTGQRGNPLEPRGPFPSGHF